MRNILRRPRTVVVATALAGSLVLGLAAAAHADFGSPSDPTAAPSVESSPAATAATGTTAATAATAETDAETAAVASCFGTYLSLGSRGTCVRLLQKNLGGLSVDGVYGTGTRSRVRSFQDDAGLTVDGKVGPQTWRKLRTYGKALAWVSGVTMYMCKVNSETFRVSVWNNSGKWADWAYYMWDHGYPIDGEVIGDDRIATQFNIYAGAYDGKQFTAWVGTYGNAHHTKSVRDISRNTLPACA
ncbi:MULTISPECIES: peptidoglycan-binding domain-containing protein [unclassified Kribbella]|uniref:peptidoglycan-binding domain-containing protein n=1 Tax=unclassified Kribbella TaxID=2644121 RepID=UPI0033F5C8E8